VPARVDKIDISNGRRELFVTLGRRQEPRLCFTPDDVAPVPGHGSEIRDSRSSSRSEHSLLTAGTLESRRRHALTTRLSTGSLRDPCADRRGRHG
jgi:hypothetical protein